MYYTYVLELHKDGSLYYGYTKDLTQRFEQHQKGQVSSTKSKLPAKLIYYEACGEQADALKRERYFKSYRGRQFLQNRLKSYFTGPNKQPKKTS
jgi:putative endonuclease